MVQVDVFWGYGWGASLAAAAGHKLRKTTDRPLETKEYAQTLLFLSLFWAPTGMLLLLRHPSWETMQAADTFFSMSEWLILGFGVTNITQGMLGFWIGERLMRAGKTYLAQLNWVLGYFGMFYILLYGWDGLGYDRFLYDRDLLAGSPAWTPGAGTAAGVWPAIGQFLTSSVAMTLYTDALWILPAFVYYVHVVLKGSAQADASLPWQTSGARWGWLGRYLAGVFVVGVGTAAVCALATRGFAYALGVPDHVSRGLGQAPAATLQHVLAYPLGLGVGLIASWYALLKPGRPFAALLQPLTGARTGRAAAAATASVAAQGQRA